LVIEVQANLRRAYVEGLRQGGYAAQAVGTVERATTVLRGSSKPWDVVLSELRLPDGDVFTIIKEAKAHTSSALVAVVSKQLDASSSLSLAEHGAIYFPKPFHGPHLAKLLAMLERRRAGALLNYAMNRALSPRERDALRYSIERCSLRVAATRMGVSQNTLKKYWARIFEKTGLRSQRDVVRDVLMKRD
jgi:DNA-binding response OmpR family regulator